jgi:methylenetetrahydrofolate dehydrogenase (NADP+)/methenyltetrahydrofolate cyclohydrolase
MITFDGNAFARQKETELQLQVADLKKRGISPKITAILFTEDKGSELYTNLKKQAAERIGMSYDVCPFSMKDDPAQVGESIRRLNEDTTVSGIIIQKPWRTRWVEVTGRTPEAFTEWWSNLVLQIDETKDVDGLHPATLEAIKKGGWQQDKKVMPATAKATLLILNQAIPDTAELKKQKIIILGKSDILGQPLYYEFKNLSCDVEMIGSKELVARKESGQLLQDADIIISATGHANLITGDLVKEGVVVVDVGEPKPDVEFSTVSQKAKFITPVPGGVGPVTIVSLLENCIELLK